MQFLFAQSRAPVAATLFDALVARVTHSIAIRFIVACLAHLYLSFR
jgi:hypothetical protein